MQRMTRRQMLQWTGAGTAALLVPIGCSAKPENKPEPQADDKKNGYPFELPKLPYEFNALEPHIDAQTMEIHHDRHHQGYVNNLNTALKDHPNLHKMSVVELVSSLDKVPEAIRTAVRNNGGGHLNHSMFWQMMTKGGGGQPSGELAKAIDSAFESFDKFQAAFATAAGGRFGSGWAWLVVEGGKLAITSTPNQDSTLMGKAVGVNEASPILGIDVWEHAYYLKYQNKRADYVKAWWNVVNWKDVADRYSAAMKK